VVVDDHELLRAGTRRILEDAPAFSVIGEAEDGESAIVVIDRLVPDAVLVDIRLPAMNGIELARRVVSAHPEMTIIILSAYDDEDYIRAALAAGVSGYLLKTTPSHELVSAITEACMGRTVLDNSVSARLVGGMAAGEEETTGSRLTARERDVLRLVAQGLANKAIGQRLGISPRTVEGHLNHIFEKLGTTSRTELVHVAMTKGLLLPDQSTIEDARR
jgi:DNA-binding NarL/FixJ family response regulator